MIKMIQKLFQPDPPEDVPPAVESIPLTDEDITDLTDDELRDAALRLMCPQVKHVYESGTLTECAIAREQIANLYEKYENYEPARFRQAIFFWLRSFSNDLNKIEEDIQNGWTRRERADYNARTEAVLRRLGH